MFSRNESQKLRQEFWTSFGKSFPRKWLLYNTGIKVLNFKFHFDLKTALVALDVEGNSEQRTIYWEKLLQLKPILVNKYVPNATFEYSYFLENSKELSRIYAPLNKKVSIHDKSSWQETMVFFKETMSGFEDFYTDYKDVLL